MTGYPKYGIEKRILIALYVSSLCVKSQKYYHPVELSVIKIRLISAIIIASTLKYGAEWNRQESMVGL